MNMTNEERKERLGRLRELNLRALGVSSFEEPLVCVQTASGGSVTLQLLAELRDRKRCICRNSSKR